MTSEQAEAAKCVNESKSINRVAKANLKQPIRTRDERNSRDESKKHCRLTTRVSKMSDKSPSIKLLNGKLLPANYVADKLMHKVISLVKTCNKTGVSRLPSPWREKFQSFSVDEKNLLYMDNRLVISQSMRSMIMCSLHYGHPGRDSMLAMIEDIWWSRINREIIDQARLCEQCLESGKNLKCILGQNRSENYRR